MFEKLQNTPKGARTAAGVAVLGGIGLAAYRKLGRKQTGAAPEDLMENLPFTRTQFERACDALMPFVDEWHLPLNPENTELMAYAVLKHASSPRGLDTAEDYAEIDEDVRGMIAEQRESHQRMLEAQSRSIQIRTQQ